MTQTKAPIHQLSQCLHHLPNDDNKKRVIWIVVMLLISIELPEAGTYASYLFPDLVKVQKDLFLSPHFHYKLYEYYYVKFTSERLAWIIRMLAFTKTAAQYSTVIFLSTFLIFCYLLVDLFLFWYNYNTSPLLYEFLILFLYITIKGLIRPYKSEAFAKIRSIF